jgi:hypothetical protein
VIGIRIMWGFDDHHRWREQIEKGELVGPHMAIASAIIDGPKPFWPGSISVTNQAEARQAVLKSKSDGADFVKVYSFLPRDAYLAIADQSKQAGIPFVGHVPMTVSVLEASEAGQKSIEHLTGLLQACSRREDVLMSEKNSRNGSRTLIAPRSKAQKAYSRSNPIFWITMDRRKPSSCLRLLRRTEPGRFPPSPCCGPMLTSMAHPSLKIRE